MRFSRRGAAAVLALAAFPAISPAAAIFTDGFDTTGSSSSYATFITAGATGPSGDATFAYNYGAAPGSGGLSIPVAPHTTDGSTTGLRVRTDNLQSTAARAVGASEVTTNKHQLPKKYTVQVDVWSNYIGGSNISASGSNGSTGVNVGIGTTSTTSDTINANNGAMYEAYGDNGGGTNSAYRVYNDNTHALPTDTTNYYQAGNGANSATFSDPYYTSKFPSVSAPAGQVSFASATQGGSTPAGVQGFNWHTWTITQDGTNITWAIDGKNISIVPDSKVTLAGQQVSLGNDDGGLTGSSAANNQLFNAEIFDNLNVTTIGPEAWLSSAPMLPQGGTAGGTATITGSATHYLATGVATGGRNHLDQHCPQRHRQRSRDAEYPGGPRWHRQSDHLGLVAAGEPAGEFDTHGFAEHARLGGRFRRELGPAGDDPEPDRHGRQRLLQPRSRLLRLHDRPRCGDP